MLELFLGKLSESDYVSSSCDEGNGPGICLKKTESIAFLSELPTCKYENKFFKKSDIDVHEFAYKFRRKHDNARP